MNEAHDEWYTRKTLYNELCTRYCIFPKLDIAASAENSMCENWLGKEDDVLNGDWLSSDEVVDIWMNPPLLKGNTKRFVLKAYEQWQRYNMNILSIVPSGVISRNWFRPLWDNFITKGGIVIDPIKRPSFLDHGDEPKFAARNDYIALLFRRKEALIRTEI